jgi:hypothetical protein
MAEVESLTGADGGATVRCRYCGQLNQTRQDGGQARCGRCRLTLSAEPHKKFAELDKHDYVHPADSRALAALRAIPGLDRAVKEGQSIPPDFFRAVAELLAYVYQLRARAV